MSDTEKGVWIGSTCVLILVVACVITWAVTSHAWERAAIANGAASHVIVDGSAEFSWNAPR